VELIKSKRSTGITLTALGFGTERVNDSMMEKVSNAGNGTFSVIASESQAKRYAAERLLSSLVLVAKDMKLQVEFNPERVRAYRLLGYEDRAIADQDFRNDTVDAGEVGAGHRVTALYELVLGDDALPDAAGEPVHTQGERASGSREVSASDLVLVKVRYKAPDAAESDPASEVATALAPEAIAADPSLADDDFRWAAAVAAFAEVLKGSAFAERDALDTIGATLEAQRARDRDRSAFADQFKLARALLH
jgi:Ca-activated chloride channel family protein